MSIRAAARSAIYALDSGRCHYRCGRVAVTLDHIVPRVAGGPDFQWNLVGACKECNIDKGAKRGVCDCPRCLWAEHCFAERNFKPKAPKRAKPRKPVVAPPLSWSERWVPSKLGDSRCPITLDGQHVVACSGMANYCARCFEILAA